MAPDEHPFRGSTARRRGRHTPATLRARCRRVLPDVHVSRRVELTPQVLARAAACWGGADAVVTGWSAAALHGARWLPTPAVPEVAVPGHVRHPPGLLVHQVRLPPDEVEDVDGVRVTTPARTAYDLGRRLPLLDAVAAVDHLCWVGVTGPDAVVELVEGHPGDRGLVALRAVLELADAGAASPQESALRVLLVAAGLPRPETQLEVRGADGRFLARADLGWRRWRVLVEYEGAQHGSARQLTRDVDRYHHLDRNGWAVVRVTASHLLGRPDEVVRRVVDALLHAGAPVEALRPAGPVIIRTPGWPADVDRATTS